MLKKIVLSGAVSLIAAISLNAECVCFELEGKFGEEIKEILQKYSKNLGSDNIKVVREDSDLRGNSMTSSFLGLGSDDGTSAGKKSSKKSLEAGQKVYEAGCVSCHGKYGEENTKGKKSLSDFSRTDLYTALFDYRDGTYIGPSRFSKNMFAQNLTGTEIDDLVAYIKSLNETTKAEEQKEVK